MITATERVVLLDEDGYDVGAAAKAEVHHRATPLHLAFSCYLFDGDGSVMLSQRARHKRTWPGAWTNSFCGHPGPAEGFVESVHRRAEQELGVGLLDLELVLPAFRYQATMLNGVRENEMCPVFTARTSGPVTPDPSEVADTLWLPWIAFRDAVLTGRREISPWCRDQVAQLAERELPDGGFRPGDPAELPPAARDEA